MPAEAPEFTPRPFDQQWADIGATWDRLRIGPEEYPDPTPNKWGQSLGPYNSPYSAHHYHAPDTLTIGNINDLGWILQDMIRGSERQGEALLGRIGELDDLPGELETWKEGFEAQIAPDRTRLTETEAMLQQFGARLGDIEAFLGPGTTPDGPDAGVPTLQDKIDTIMDEVGGTESQLTDLIDRYSGDVGDVSSRLDRLTGQYQEGDTAISARLDQLAGDTQTKQQILDQQHQTLKEYVTGDGAPPQAAIGGVVIGPDGQWQTGHDAVNQPGLLNTLDQKYLTQAGFDEAMATRLEGLQSLLTDEWGEDIERLDIDAIREAIAGVGGDLTQLSSEFTGADAAAQARFAGLGESLTGLRNRLSNYGTEATEREAEAEAARQALGGRISEEALAREALGGTVTERFGQAATARQALGGELADLESSVAEGFSEADVARQLLRTDVAQQFGQQDVAREALRGELNQLIGQQGGAIGELRGDVSQRFTDIGREYSRLFGEEALARQALGGNLTQQLATVRGEGATGREAIMGQMGLGFSEAETARQALSGQMGLGLSEAEAARQALAGQVGTGLSEAEAAREALRGEAATGRQALSGQIDTGLGQAETAREALRGEAATGREAIRGESATAREALRGESAAARQAGFSEAQAARQALETDVTKQFGTVDRRFAEQETAREQMGSRLTQEWSSRLDEQDKQFRESIASAKSDYDRRLKDLSANMNYRFLDDNVLGVKSRRSKAFRSGAARRGTGQLSRVDRVNTLNIA